jgi:hypothetical protein
MEKLSKILSWSLEMAKKALKKCRKSRYESLSVQKIHTQSEIAEVQEKIEKVKVILSLMFKDLNKKGRPLKDQGLGVQDAA